MSLHLENVAGVLEVHTDGDQRINGRPSFFYLDTKGGFVTGSIRIEGAKWGVGLEMKSVMANQFQIYSMLGYMVAKVTTFYVLQTRANLDGYGRFTDYWLPQ